MKVDPLGLNHRLKNNVTNLVLMMFFSSKLNYEIRTDARDVAKGGDGVARAPRNLADQLTLLNPGGGGRLCPSHYCQPPWMQNAIYTSGCHYSHQLVGI